MRHTFGYKFVDSLDDLGAAVLETVVRTTVNGPKRSKESIMVVKTQSKFFDSKDLNLSADLGAVETEFLFSR